MGLTLADYSPEELGDLEIDVWLCNLHSVNLFISVVTNWIYAGMNGVRVALNYQSVESALRMTNTPRSRWPEIFADLRVMEDAALAQMRENQKDDQ